MSMRMFDTQKEEWIDLDALGPSARKENAELPLHPKRCGPCEDCREALVDYATIPAYAERLPQESEQERDEAAFWLRLNRPFAPPGLNPDAVGRSMRHASGHLAGEYARRFWQSRIAADKAAVPFTEPTDEELARHVARYGTAGIPKFQAAKPKTAEELAAASKDRDLAAVAKKREAKKTARRPSVKSEVADLLKRKPELLPSVVADVVGISDRRAKKILAELMVEG
jgi:hypothetical protein